LEALGSKRRVPTPDVPNAPDPHSKNTSTAVVGLRLVEEDVKEDNCREEESTVDNVLEAGEREGEGVTRGQESRMQENSQEDLRPQEMNTLKTGFTAPSHIGGSRKAFSFAVAERPKIFAAGRVVQEPKRTSRAE